MVLRVTLKYSQLTVFVFFLIFRVSIQKISPQSAQNRNDVNIYPSAYIDTAFCKTIPGLTKFQIELCKEQPDTTMVALEGLNRAVRECQNQFSGHRWNCSSLTTRGKNPYITAMLQKGYKETAFSYAIASAGVAIAVAKACSSSALQNCGCDETIYKMRKPRPILKQNRRYSSERINFLISTDETWKIKADYSDTRNAFRNVNSGFIKEGSFESNAHNLAERIPNTQVTFPKESLNPPISWKWKGCSHNLKYGIRFSKLFLDSREKADDIRSRTNLHNNQVGRMIVKHNMNVTCKCHGTSGSCSIKTCWRSTPDLKIIGHALKERFAAAVLVDHSSMGSKNLRKFNTIRANSKSEKKKRPNKRWQIRQNKKKRDLSSDLLYYEKSPNFCDKIPDLDVPGTTGRLCNSTIKVGPNSCSSLCCGRGYNSIKHSSMEHCKCKFIGCCNLKCDICNNTSWVSVCK